MFKSVRSISYPVSDIEKGREWYNSILGIKPVFENPLLTIYRINDFTFSLIQEGKGNEIKENPPVVFWEVEDIDSAFNKLIESGARPVSEISIYFNSRMAKLADPFGNIIGLSCSEAPSSKSLDDRPSETAMTVAFCRAFACLEEQEEIRGKDYLAEIFLNEEAAKPLKDKKAVEWVKKNIMTDGSYEFITCRTVFYDNEVQKALADDIPQIVFLGAGYDSRAYRFAGLIKNTCIYELDIKSTQQRKIEILKKAGIDTPANLKFVEIDFTKDKILDVLTAAGYKREMKTLFIWEGVLYYLTKRVIDGTLEIIKQNSPSGSIICFDYTITAPDMKNRYKAKEVRDKMKTRYSAEPVQEGFEEGKMGEYLDERGFKLVEHYNPEEMENKYLKLKDGSIAGKVTGIFCLAKAEVN